MALFRRKKSRRARLEQRAETLLAHGRSQVAALADDAGQAREAASARAAVVAQAVKGAPGALAPGAAGKQARDAARHAADAALSIWEQGEGKARATLRAGEAWEQAVEQRALGHAHTAEERAAVVSRAAEDRADALSRAIRETESNARKRGKQAKTRLSAAERDATDAVRHATARAGEIADESVEAGRNLAATFLWAAAAGFVMLVVWLGREERQRVVELGKSAVGEARKNHSDAHLGGASGDTA